MKVLIVDWHWAHRPGDTGGDLEAFVVIDLPLWRWFRAGVSRNCATPAQWHTWRRDDMWGVSWRQGWRDDRPLRWGAIFHTRPARVEHDGRVRR